MSTVQLLNLDELTPEIEKKVVLKGEPHFARELTVEEYVSRVRRAKQVEVSDDPAANVQRAVELVGEVFPTLTPELVQPLSLRALKAILDLALAQPEDVAKQASAAEAAPAAAEPGNA